MPESKFAAEMPDGTTRSYTIRHTMVTLRHGRKIKVNYLSADDPVPLMSPEYQVRESSREDRLLLSLEALVCVAKAAMEHYGYGSDEAAEMAAMLNAEDLSSEQIEELIRNVRAALDNQE